MQYLQGMILVVVFIVCSHTEPVFGSRIWGFLGQRALSPDNTCGLVGAGSKNGYTCDASMANGGSCCSANGYCGSTDAYCGVGCQSAYGTCSTTSLYVCGPMNDGLKCAENQCCSQAGYCGNTTDYCGTGCRYNYGRCPLHSTSSSTPTAKFTSSSSSSTNMYTCGPNQNNLRCAENQCCSWDGNCGNTTAECGTGCRYNYGRCPWWDATASTVNGPSPTSNSYICGPNNMDLHCAENQCCSWDGNCGNTTAQCGTGCRYNYGRCPLYTPSTSVAGSSSLVTSSSNQALKTSAPGGRCGASKGVCPSGQCCSPAGWCGTTSTYCADPDCQYQYGTCDSNTAPAGASTANDPRPLLGSVTYDNDIIDCVAKKVVALTFDDGPYLYTGQMLDILKQFNFSATFFMTGNNNGKGPIDTTAPYPSLVQRMINEGHQVASHTWSHYSLQSISSSMRLDQMTKNERAIANIIGKYPTYMRPPYSQCNQASGCWADMKKLGYHRVYFDLDTSDYLNPLPSQIQASKDIVNSMLTGARYKSATDYLSIQHDIVQQSVTNLSTYYYDLIAAKGWRGVTVGECLNDPQSNWYRTPGATSTSSSSSTQRSSIVTGTPKTAAATASSAQSTIALSANSSSPMESSTVSTNTMPTNVASTATAFTGPSSTICSLTTGLSTEGVISGISLYEGNTFLSNATSSTQAASTGSPDPGVVATSSAGTRAGSTSRVPVPTPSTSNTGLADATSPELSSTSTSAGPAIPTSASFGYQYIGCFAEVEGYRAVSGSGYETGLTVESCASYCHNKSAPIFAVEYYGECFCGQALNSTLGRSTGCNYTCYKNSSEICGGSYAAQVYSAGLLASSLASKSTLAPGSISTALAAASTSANVCSSTACNTTGVLAQKTSAVALTNADDFSAVTTSQPASWTLVLPSYSPMPSSNRFNFNSILSQTATANRTVVKTNSSPVSASSPNTSIATATSIRMNATNVTTTKSPTSSCLVSLPSFCGTLAPFSGQSACWDSVTNCTEQNLACYDTAQSDSEKGTCADYTQKCILLFWFCRNDCASGCLSADFKPI